MTRRRGRAADDVAKAKAKAKVKVKAASASASASASAAPASRSAATAAGIDVEALRRVARRIRAEAPSGADAGPANAVDAVARASAVELELISGRGHYDRVIAAVREAHTSVWIATANVKALMVEDSRAAPGRRRSMRRTAYVSIVALLDELAARGVELRLLHAELPSGPFRDEVAKHPRLLATGGLELARCPRVHMKAVIVDGALLYLGSANWTGAGLGAKGSGRRNFELGVVTDHVDLLDRVQALYEHIWSGGECDACKLRQECPGPLSGLRTQRTSQVAATTATARTAASSNRKAPKRRARDADIEPDRPPDAPTPRARATGRITRPPRRAGAARASGRSA